MTACRIAGVAVTFAYGFVALPAVGMAVGLSQMQPGVDSCNASLLSGVCLTSVGFGTTLVPQLLVHVAESAGTYLAAAWTGVSLMAISLVVILVVVPGDEPVVTTDTQRRPIAASSHVRRFP